MRNRETVWTGRGEQSAEPRNGEANQAQADYPLLSGKVHYFHLAVVFGVETQVMQLT